MMQGFFNILTEKPKRAKTALARSVKEVKEPCEVCKLYKGCKSPKMQYSGKGRKRILIIAEAPGKTEDDKGTQLVGEAGQLLRKSLRDLNIDIDLDCWKTNSIICRPSDNKKPTKKQLKLCQHNLNETIKKLNPAFIWLIGGSAIETFYSDRFTDTSINTWRRRLIPDHELGCFVIPMFHPSFPLRNQDDKLKQIFDNDLKWAVSCLNSKYPKSVNIDDVKVLADPKEIIDQLKKTIRNKEKVVMDYETSHLSPYINGIKIWTIAYNGMSFGLDHPDVKYSPLEKKSIELRWRDILSDPLIKKTAHNLKFEDGWSRSRFNVIPKGWDRCTMVTQHVLEYRPTSVALKFQAFVNWGIPDYEKATQKYITKGSREQNKLDEMPLLDLCKYNAIDTLVTALLANEQSRKLSVSADLKRANDLFFEGILAFCDIENNGICVNSKWYKSRDEELTILCKALEKKMLNGDDAKKFKEREGNDLSISSNKDLTTLFFDILELPVTKTTAGGAPSVDVEALTAINSPFVTNLLKYRKMIKIRDTFLAQFIRETTNGKIHPSFNLHTVDTYRSSSSGPNFQNIPIRDEDAKREVRSGVVPSKGNKILEIDYAAMEVRICACYTLDPTLIKYINNPEADMHKDQGMLLFKLAPEQMTKDIRFHAKNRFVFPEIYGSYFVTCARSLWEVVPELTLADGTPLRKHLRNIEIYNLESFTDHVKIVENNFWDKFPLIKEWNEKNAASYARRGYLTFLFGHRRGGYLSRNALSNYPIQGAAFHCLLWSVIELNKLAQKEKWKTKIIGQIHDSIVFDLHPSEEDYVIKMAKWIMTEKIRKEFPFIIVPLEVEVEITPIDKSWYEKAGIGKIKAIVEKEDYEPPEEIKNKRMLQF